LTIDRRLTEWLVFTGNDHRWLWLGHCVPDTQKDDTCPTFFGSVRHILNLTSQSLAFGEFWFDYIAGHDFICLPSDGKSPELECIIQSINR
jgi:hypothetical protein